jgi:hypothetical protein
MVDIDAVLALSEAQAEVHRLRNLLKSWLDAYTAYLDLDRTDDYMFDKPCDETEAILKK